MRDVPDFRSAGHIYKCRCSPGERVWRKKKLYISTCSCASTQIHEGYITDVVVFVLCFLDLQTGIVSSIVSITDRPGQLGRDQIAIVTSLLENQTDIAAGNATVSES